MGAQTRIVQFVQLAAVAIVAVACYTVVSPLIPALLFALVVCIATWPLYLRLRRALREKSTLAAALMVLMLVVLVIVPSALLAVNLAYNVTALIDSIKVVLAAGPIEPPAWIKDTVIFGERLGVYWQGIASGGEEAVALFKDMLDPTRNFLFSSANEIGQSLVQMIFAAFIGFFFYRDGEVLVDQVRAGLTKVAGGLVEDILTTIQNTVSGVVNGIFGAALAQSVVAVIGFLIAGVPGAFLLGAATFVLSWLPIGPPLLWGGASVWLFYQGSVGWGVFMIVWGIVAISSIDNFVLPYLISRGSKLSLLLTTLGVFGGIVAFGFIGLFIGPPILAVGLTLIRLWTVHPHDQGEA